MVRFLVLYEMPEDPAAFDKHYDEIHVPLVKKLPGLARYTVSRNIVSLGGRKYYLVAELDWETRQDMQAAFGSQTGQKAAADVSRFAPGDKSHSFIFEVAEV